MAFLISGQLYRFIYKDQEGPLVAAPPSPNCPAPTVDVHILMHNGTAAGTNHGVVTSTPYAANSTIDDIQRWYRNRGANKVYVRLVDDEFLDKFKEDLWSQVSTRHLKKKKEFVAFLEEYAKTRFHPYSNMFYKRHLAYQMTQPRQYDAYVSMREDNYFIEPLNWTALEYDNRKAKDSSAPYLMVEKFCEWWGANSDKLHIGNAAGMTALWGDNWKEFVDLMIRWTDHAYIRKTLDEFKDPFQTESFLTDLMISFTILRRDLKRIDLRYNGEHLCVHEVYLDCTGKASEWYKRRLTDLGVKICDKVPKKKKKRWNK